MNTLTYQRQASKAKDGLKGYLYKHNFGTGWEALVFTTKEKAIEYAKAKGLKYCK